MAQVQVEFRIDLDGKTVSGVDWLQYDNRHVLFSDGKTGLYVWDGSTTAPRLVGDLSPYLADRNGGPGVELSAVPNVPAGRFLVQYRGRVFFADPIQSKVYYSGTRNDFVINEGENHASNRPIRPWELWNIGMDLSRANAGNGGSMLIGDRSQNITALIPTENGLLVCKEREIYLWTWPETAAPHEVSLGAYARPIIQGVGVVSAESVARDGEVLYFLGQRSRNDISVFRMLHDNIEDVGAKIRPLFESFAELGLQKGRSRGIIHGGYYYLILPDAGSENPIRKRFVAALDIARGAWVSLFTPIISDVTSIPRTAGLRCAGADGIIYAFPSTLPYDQTAAGESRIPWTYAGREIDDGTTIHDKKYRKAWLNADVMVGDAVADLSEDVEASVEYEDGSDVTSKTVTGAGLVSMFLQKRALRGRVVVHGESLRKVRLRNITLAWRSRKDKP